MNTRIALGPAVLVVVVACFGCGREPAAPAPSGDTPTPATPPAAGARRPEYAPEYTLAIETSQSEPQTYTVVWTAKVNTGGWSMKVDQALVEDLMGKPAVRLWVILEQPGPNEMVTEAFETLTERYDAGTTQIDRAELSIKRTVRGETPTFAPLYTVVKTVDR